MSSKPKKRNSKSKSKHHKKKRETVRYQQQKFKKKKKKEKQQFVWVDVLPQKVENRPEQVVCGKLYDVLEVEFDNWRRDDSSDKSYYNAYKANPLSMHVITTDANDYQGTDWNANTLFYPEYHVHDEHHKWADKIRIFTQRPPISDDDYKDYPSNLQPCYPKMRQYNRLLIEHVEENIVDDFERPASADAIYGDDYGSSFIIPNAHTASRQSALTGRDADFSGELGEISAFEANVVILGICFALLFCVSCFIWCLLVIIAFFSGRWYQHYDKDRSIPSLAHIRISNPY